MFPPSRKAPTERQAHGRQGEALARRYLERQGYAIEAANVRLRPGELDVVALDGPTLCFIEVRTVTTKAFGPATASIDQRKRRHVLRAARSYLQARRPAWAGEIRFDVVAIDASSATPAIELIRNAFDATDGSKSWW